MVFHILSHTVREVMWVCVEGDGVGDSDVGHGVADGGRVGCSLRHVVWPGACSGARSQTTTTIWGLRKEIEKLEACTPRLIKYPRSTELESCDQGQEEDTCLEL